MITFRKLKHERVFVFTVLLIMGCLMAFSVSKDSLTTDEGLYLPTGYYYLTEQKANIGYEHPPLVRDIAAIPLLFLSLRPASSLIDPQSLQNLENAVWTFGNRFIYEQSETADKILWYGRISMVLLTLVLGYFLFASTKNLFGTTAAALALLLYAFSPFFLAHGRYVTTDVASAFGCLATIYFFQRYLRKPNWTNTIVAGLVLGFSLLVKFPLLTLIPFLIFMNVLWFWGQSHKKISARWKFSMARFGLLFSIAIGVIYFVYAFHIWNYPKAEHIADIERTFQLTRGHAQSRLSWISNLAQYDVLRPLLHYVYGLSWQFSRTGAFGYFMGEGSFTSWISYYPFGYFAKNPIGLHLLVLLALYFAFERLRQNINGELTCRERFKKIIGENFWVIISLTWIAYYLFILIFVNKGNTGSRYLMPILPFIFILVGKSVGEKLSTAIAASSIKSKTVLIVSCVLLFQIVSVLRLHPSYLTYFNELVGGPEKGPEYLVDTDVDWGQDKRRLAIWAKEKNITQLQIANGIVYAGADGLNQQEFSFSSSDFQYYLGEMYKPYLAGTPVKGWLAVPARIMKWGQTQPADKQGWYSQSYGWLQSYEPVEKLGYSIWIYHFK